MNAITRRYMCFACGKSYNVSPWLGGCWHITHAVSDAIPFIVSAVRPICLDPRCGSRELADMNSERVATEDGRVIVLDRCERPCGAVKCVPRMVYEWPDVWPELPE